nr:retrotransposon protein, putative, unclassified [Tanacetum cinerariifolium]
MGYEKPSTKLTFYKAFFSPQWKFLIHTILKCMSGKRTSWNEFSSSIASTIICLSTGRKFNFSKYIFDSLVRNVDSSTKFYMYARFLQLIIRAQVDDLSSHTTKYSSPSLTQKVFANMRRAGKGFSGVETPLFKGMIVAQQADEGTAGVDVGVVPAAADEPSIPSHTPINQPLPPSQELPSTSQVMPTPPPSPIAEPSSPPQQPQPSQPTHDAQHSMDLLHTLLETFKAKGKEVGKEKHVKSVWIKVIEEGEIIELIDADKDVSLENVESEKDADDDELEPAELKEVVEVVTTAKLMTEVVTAAVATITAAVATITAATTLITAAKITTAPSAARKRKGVIEQDKAYARELEAELNKNINWDDVIEQVQRKEKEDNAMLRYQALKMKPQIEAQARKNMIIYLRNMAGFKMDYFKGMSYDDIRPIFKKYFNSNVAFLEKTKEQMKEEDNRALKRTSESLKKKAAKKQKLDEEDTKTLMEPIEKRFGGNKENKKKLISQLEILGESLSQEDINLKFLRSLPTEWRTYTLIWRNKTDLEEQSLDDFTNGPVNVVASVSAASEKILISALLNVDTLSNAAAMTRAFKQKKNQPTMPSWHSPPQVLSVLTMRPFVKPVENYILATNPKTEIPKPQANGNNRNRKACFVCKSLTYLIKDYDYYEKTMAQTPARNHYARMTLPNPQRHVVPTAVLTKSKLVPLTAVRPVTTATPQPHVTRSRPAKTIVTKSYSPPRRNISRRLSPKPSNFPPKVTTVKILQTNAVKGVQGKWEWKPICLILDHDSRHTSASITLKRTPSIGFMRPFGCLVTILNILDPLGKFDGKANEGFLVGYSNTDDDAAFEVKEPEFEGRKPDYKVYVSPSSKFEDFFDNNINEVNAAGTSVPAVGQISTNSTNTFSAAGPSNTDVSPTHGKSSYVDTSQYHDDTNMLELKDITYSDNKEDVGAKANFTNLETTITASPIPATRVHKDHPVTQIIGDLSSATQTRSMTRVVKDQGHTQKEGIDYEEVFAPVARIEAIRLFLAYASFMGFMVYQMDVESAVMYGTINEEAYVCQPPGFENPDYHDKQKPDGIFISQDKYVAEILRKFGLRDRKSASTPIDSQKPLLKDSDGEDVNVHTYRSMIVSLMYLTCRSLSLKLMVGKGFSGIDTPLFKGMIVAQQDDDVADEGVVSVVVDDVPAVVDEPSIPSPTPTTQPPPPSQDLPSTS